jgi:hypothetical protein
MPATGKPRSVVIMAHPRADFSGHYSIPFRIDAGFAAFGFNTRYLNNNDSRREIEQQIFVEHHRRGQAQRNAPPGPT